MAVEFHTHEGHGSVHKSAATAHNSETQHTFNSTSQHEKFTISYDIPSPSMSTPISPTTPTSPINIPTQFQDSREFLRPQRGKRLRDESEFQVNKTIRLSNGQKVRSATSGLAPLHIETNSQSSYSPKSVSLSPNSPTTPELPYTKMSSKLKVKDVHGRSKTVVLTAEKIRSLFHLPQPQAAQELGIGLSTLKKHAKAFKMERWPNPRERSRILMERGTTKLKMPFLLNDEEHDTREIDNETIEALRGGNRFRFRFNAH